MSLAVTYLGHSGVLLESDGHAVVIDPFLTGCPTATHKPEDVRCQYVALTHGHDDHVGDGIAIAKANGAKVVAVYEMTLMLAKAGCAVEPGNPGGKIKTPFGWIAFTQAFHSSSYEGAYMGQPVGFVVHFGKHTVYHCGDTGIFGDMKLIGEIYKPDVAFVPIGDRFTMGPELASRAAELINPKVAVPIHYNTWPPIAQDPADFRPENVHVKVIDPGSTWTYQ